ncbi:MAG: S8 family serine peptidase, partial [Roseiflexus sp.]
LSSPEWEGAFVPNEILIGLNPEAMSQTTRPDTLSDTAGVASLGITSLDRLSRRYRVQAIVPLFDEIGPADQTALHYGLHGMYKVVVPMGVDIFAMIADYSADPAIAYAEPNRIYQVMEIPNDPDFSKQWGLHNTGQTGGRVDADIDAPEAWEITTGSSSVLIAVIDTGVDYTHPDLSGGRVRTDIDRDFVNDDEDAMDDHGHGTFVAGIAAANTNNEQGIAGVCPGCQILPVKVLDKDGRGSADKVARGIQYAAQAGARIISMSLGFPSQCGCSQTLARAINYAFESGSLLIAASGNDEDKQQISYPASSPRVLSVGASDHNDQEASFSNRSSYLDVVAPGKDIYSLNLDHTYRNASGTSASTPFASGVAGLIWSVDPQLSNVQVWWRLYQSADDFPARRSSQSIETVLTPEITVDPASLVFRVYLPVMSRTRATFGRLNARQALEIGSNGQMFAPVDTCSGEPGDCAPGCGAEVALTGSTTGLHDLQVLRRFRDEQLASNAAGERWVEIYEQHRLELATLLASDAQLRAQAREALGQWLPLIRTLVEPRSEASAVIQSEHIRAARLLIENLSVRSSPELRRDLDEVAAVVDLAESYIGRDVRLFWDAFTQQSQ